ncbi:MAG: amidohydrolase family protein, partial [Pseudoflavonifractor sp.]
MNPENYDLLLRNATYLNPQMGITSGKTIAIRDGSIAAILEGDAPATAEQTMDGRGLLWMPGLVDGHTHTSQQLLRGRLLDEKPVIWKRVNVPFESRLTQESARLSAQLAALEMIKNGTTGFLDAGGKYVETYAEVYAQSGLRGGLTYMTNDSPHMPDSLRCTVSQSLARLESLSHQLGGRLRAYYSLTTLTAVSCEMMTQVLTAAKALGIPAEVHMNEYASEVLDFIERYGERPLEYLDHHDLLGEHFVAPHCIFLSQSEMDILQRHQVRVVHCPFSNCGKGIPPTPQLVARGIPVALGTDGTAHGGADLFAELRLLRSLMQVQYGVTAADS